MKRWPPDPDEDYGREPDEPGMFKARRLSSPPNCPQCRRPTRLTDERYGGKYECFNCEMWSWGAGAFRTAEGHREAKRARREWRDKDGSYPRRKPAVSMTLDEIGAPDPNAWYSILDCAPGATRDEITKAFRQKLKAVHPDVGGSDEAARRLVAARDEGLSR